MLAEILGKVGYLYTRTNTHNSLKMFSFLCAVEGCSLAILFFWNLSLSEISISKHLSPHGNEITWGILKWLEICMFLLPFTIFNHNKTQH